MSSIGQVVEETRIAFGMAKVVITESIAMRSQVESHVVSLAAQVEATTLRTATEITGQVRAVAAHAEESMSHIVGAVAQQLESEIEVAAIGTATTSASNTHAAVHG